MEPADKPHKLQQLLAGYALGNLTPTEAARVKQLLKHNPALVAELQTLQSTLAVVPLSLSHPLPSPQLEHKILQAAQATPQTAAPAVAIAPVKSRTWPWWIVGSIAAILLTGLGLETYRLRQSLAAAQLENQALTEQLTLTQATLQQLQQIELANTRQELSRYQGAVNLLRQPDNRYLTLKSTVPEQPSTGSLVIVPSQSAAILALRDVPALPEGQVYRMWAVVNGQKIACGDFQPDAAGEVFLQLPVDEWGATPEIVITVEPEQDLPEPVGEMVIFGS
ncbi:MAG: anti-sigma factor [Cyanobacteria bacterium P01_H01_bin.162]